MGLQTKWKARRIQKLKQWTKKKNFADILEDNPKSTTYLEKTKMASEEIDPRSHKY